MAKPQMRRGLPTTFPSFGPCRYRFVAAGGIVLGRFKPKHLNYVTHACHQCMNVCGLED